MSSKFVPRPTTGVQGADLIIIGVEFIEDISFVEMLQENADAFL
jgi:hypothetical protein